MRMKMAGAGEGAPMFEPFTLPFMQRALVGGVLVGLITSYYGPFVVQRRMAFLGSGLGHAAFGGIALGLLLGLNPLWVAVVFTVAAALGIVWVRDRTHLASDTAIGIFFAVSMALGIVFLSLNEGFTGDAFTYLFGSILAIAWQDVWAAAAVAALTALSAPLWGRWAYATFDPMLARADRISVLRDDYLLSASIAVAVVVSIKVVGIILVAAFLVLPSAAARLRSRTFSGMCRLSMALGAASVVLGLLVSYHADLPSGPAIVLVQAALFAALFLARGKQA